jgi:hypothetical protein
MRTGWYLRIRDMDGMIDDRRCGWMIFFEVR